MIENFNKIRVFPCFSCICKLSKISGKNYQDISEQEYQK